MKGYVRTLAFIVAAASLAFMSVAHGERVKARENAVTASVTWEDGHGKLPIGSSAFAGLKVVKDADTGRLRPARAGELPETAIARPTQIVSLPAGGGIAIVGDDLMSESVAVKQPDGSVSVYWGRETSARTRAEEK